MAGEAAGALGAAFGATPYGAAIGAAGQALSAALTETPSNYGSGQGGFQGGQLTIGAKVVGTGNTAGATSASQAQTPLTETPGGALGGIAANSKSAWILGGALVLAVLLFVFGRRQK